MSPKESSDTAKEPTPTPERTDALQLSGHSSQVSDSKRHQVQTFDIQDNRGLQLNDRINKGARLIHFFDLQRALVKRHFEAMSPEQREKVDTGSALQFLDILIEQTKIEYGIYAYQPESKRVHVEDELSRWKRIVTEARATGRKVGQ